MLKLFKCIKRRILPSHERQHPLYQKYKQHTMIDPKLFEDNIALVNDHFSDYRLSGLAVECGVWRGGMIAAIAETLGENWEFHLFDSFEGLPDAKEIDGVAAIRWQSNKESTLYYNNCMAEVSFAERAMEMAGKKAIIHKGWFDNTLPHFVPNRPISLLRLDGDWYESTMTCLKHLFPLLENNGLLIIDDYFAWDGCSKAVHDYLSSIQSNCRIRTNGYLCYIIKDENGRQNPV